MSFGTKLKEIRKEHNLNQEDMADKLYMSQSNYNKYETGNRLPNLELITQVVKLFNVDLFWLLADENQKVVFETGSTNNGNGIGNINAENYYNVPKDFMDLILNLFQGLNKTMSDTLLRLSEIEKKINN